MKQLALAAVVLVAACVPPPTPAPVYNEPFDTGVLLDAGNPPTRCGQVCAKFALLHCSQARSDCVSACENMGAFLSDLTANCILAATDVPSIQGCGSFCR